MILHKLIAHHARQGYDHAFSRLQVDEAIRWLNAHGLPAQRGAAVLDLGCGSGTFGQRLRECGCEVTFADDADWLGAEVPKSCFRRIDLDTEPVGKLGQYDLVICSNVLEHLRHPDQLIGSFASLLVPGGHFYLSWTNWLSPWGGHDFSPWHYLGPRLGPRVYDRWVGKPRLLKPFENLFVTHIGRTLRQLRCQRDLQVLAVAPRYYTELWPLMKVPLLREFLAWNCAVLLRRTA
jgi:SAM-dependent methyltransferase